MGTGGKSKKPDEKILTSAVADIKTPSPLQNSLDWGRQRTLDFVNRAGEFGGKPINVLEAPGMENALDIYGTANALAARKKVGNPMNAFAGQANPNYAAQLSKLGESERYNERAFGLNQAYRDIINRAETGAVQSSEMDFARKQAYAGAQNAYYQNYYNRPKEKPLWEKLVGFAIQGAGAAAGFMNPAAGAAKAAAPFAG